MPPPSVEAHPSIPLVPTSPKGVRTPVAKLTVAHLVVHRGGETPGDLFTARKETRSLCCHTSGRVSAYAGATGLAPACDFPYAAPLGEAHNLLSLAVSNPAQGGTRTALGSATVSRNYLRGLGL